MSTTYQTYTRNLKNYVEGLQDTNVKFMFFYADDLSKPKLKDTFKYMPLQNSYITPGVQSNGWYIYRESVLKYIVTSVALLKSNPVPIYDMSIVGTSKKTNDVNHGDHITFVVIKTKGNDVIVKMHKTEYRDNGNFDFIRYTEDCNFTFDASNINNTNAIHCESSSGAKLSSTIGSKITKMEDQAIVAKMCRVMTGDFSGGGKKQQKRKIHYKNKKCVVHKGKRNGQYVICDGKRKYIQKGGGGYKGITIFSDAFITFLSETLFKKMYSLKPDLETITVLFDEMDELGSRANDHIVMFYDFEFGMRNIFYLESNMALAACYAHGILTSSKDTASASAANQLTKIELDYYKQYQTLVGPLVNVSAG